MHGPHRKIIPPSIIPLDLAHDLQRLEVTLDQVAPGAAPLLVELGKAEGGVVGKGRIGHVWRSRRGGVTDDGRNSMERQGGGVKL